MGQALGAVGCILADRVFSLNGAANVESVFSAAAGGGFQSKLSSILDGLRLRDLANKEAFGGKIWDAIKILFDGIDLSKYTEDEFVALVDKLYDQYVGPMIIGINPVFGPILNNVVNQVVLNQARKFYKNHSQPQPA